MKELSRETLEEIAARCDSATPGPWCSFVEGRDHTSGSSFIRTPEEDIELSGASEQDQEFIACARQDIPLLVEDIRRLRGWE